MLHVVGAGEKAIELCVFVPPNDRKKIQPSCRTIGVIILNQRCAASTEAKSRSSLASATIREEIASLKGFDNCPLPPKGFYKSLQLRTGASFDGCHCSFRLFRQGESQKAQNSDQVAN